MDLNLSNELEDLEISSELEDLKGSYENYVDPQSGQGATTKLPLIQRVPFRLRNQKNFAKNYEPMVIAIGPIHHDKECRKKKDHNDESRKQKDLDKEYLSREFKQGLAHLFINNFIEDKKTTAYNKIKGNINTLKKRYEEDVIKDYDDNKLALMLFVDGCAVLAFIAKSVDETFGKDFKMKSDFEAFGAHDLFLLENQLPFEVLKILMSFSNKSSDLEEKIKKFIVRCMLHRDDPTYISNYKLPEKPNHLLELLREKFLGRANETSKCDCYPVDCIIKLISCKNKGHDVPTFRRIKELQAAGIKVKKSGTSYLKDISFEGVRILTAKLKLPPMMVDDWTAPKFLNLVAYEMCPDYFNDFEISSYVCFMDSLIDKAEDVKELRDAEVLHNSLGSDEDVAKFFNEISNDLVPNFATYNDVKEKIQKHYQNKWMTWLAQFYHDHFSSPWTILAFVAALIGLVMTGLQTWDSLKPSNGSPPPPTG